MSSVSKVRGRGAFLIDRGLGDIFHLIYWSARKLRRVARSSCTAEFWAAYNADSSLVYMKHLLSEFAYTQDATLLLYSRKFFNLSTSIREPT